MLQACTPSDSDSKVGTNETVGPKGCTGVVTSTGGCAPAGFTGGTSASTGPHVMPPQGYTTKWTACRNWVEGDLKLRNNSRVVKAVNGMVPIMRTEPVAGGEDNVRRLNLSAVPKPLKGGRALDVNTKRAVDVYKIGQLVQTVDKNGSVTQWVVASWNLGEPVRDSKTGRLAYSDTCFRNPKLGGKDTMGRVADGNELAGICVVEDLNTEYNALSAEWGWTPIYNFATGKVPMKNDPLGHPHPDDAYYVGKDATANYFTYYGAALNDVNGAERDWLGEYYVGDGWCHFIVNAGYEVPGAKRPSTKSLPAPGVINPNSYVGWRPVNPNLAIANDEAPAELDPIEEQPQQQDAQIADADTAPM
ncbi:MAG: hypothetical protein JST00_25640 [Deltaproteobacteria bacterium]|nr:hypothetical protein [Deltaproteobacteria bacterium]